MLIDWFTVIAQALNFLILVWLMKRFLYRPILSAIDAREKFIATQLADADKKKIDAEREKDEFYQKNKEFNEQRVALISKATDEALAERQRLIDEARKNAEFLILKQREALKEEEHNLYQTIGHQTQQEVFEIARKTLSDLAGTSLEEQMVNIFIRKLRELSEEEKKALIFALNTSPSPVIVRSTFDLPAAQCALTERAIKETIGSETQVLFETAPNLISGIEFTTNGQKVAWSISNYLASMEKSVNELLREKDKEYGK